MFGSVRQLRCRWHFAAPLFIVGQERMTRESVTSSGRSKKENFVVVDIRASVNNSIRLNVQEKIAFVTREESQCGRKNYRK